MGQQALVLSLNKLLSNCYVMHVKLHRYHWYVQGEQFFQLHDVFEEMYDMFHEDIDEIAERILMIKGRPLATMAKYIKEASIEESTADNEVSEMIEQLLHDYGKMVSEITEEIMPLASEQEDEPTLDLLIDLQARLEKYIWMLEAYSHKR